VRKADLPPSCAVVTKSGNLNFLEISGHLKECNGTGLPLTLPYNTYLECDLTYLLTYSMAQSPSWEANWFAASQEIPRIYGTRRFITALTSVRELSLSWASPIQSIYPHPTSCRSVLILSTHIRLGLPSSLLPSGFPTKLCVNLKFHFHWSLRSIINN